MYSEVTETVMRSNFSLSPGIDLVSPPVFFSLWEFGLGSWVCAVVFFLPCAFFFVCSAFSTRKAMGVAECATEKETNGISPICDIALAPNFLVPAGSKGGNEEK